MELEQKIDLSKLPDDALLTTEYVSELLDLKPQTLRRWRCNGSPGPKFVRNGSRVRYRAADVRAYIRATVEHT